MYKSQPKMSKRIKISYKQGTEQKPPRKKVISVILSNSSSQDFDEAKQEFIVESIIDEADENFTGCCQLCGTTGLKYNFVLHNTKTGIKLNIGTTCIIRFGVGQGVYDVDTGVTLLQNVVDERYLINELQTSVKSVMVWKPESQELGRFHTNLKKYMELRGIKNPTDEQLGEVFFGNSWREMIDPIKLDRMRKIWDRPAYIETIRRTNVKHNNNPKEGTTWYKKRRHVLHHGGSSEIFNVEEYVLNKK